MASDWDTPVLATAYATFLTNMKERDLDALTMTAPGANIPTDAIRLVRAGNDVHMEEWSGAAWVDQILTIAGGGTGAATAGTARTALGLGTMAIQNKGAVDITGGTIVDCTLTATVDDTEYIGSYSFQFAKAYFKTGLKIPVGADKYLSS